MKKTILAFFAATFAAVTFAALDTTDARAIPVLAPTAITAGTTNATTVADVRGLRGTAEVIVYAAAASDRTELTATLYATNRTDGGWTKYTERKETTEDAAILRLPFAGIYQPGVLKVEIGSIGAATTASAFILSF